ncbi:MAG TPA: hypothetical protein VN736_25280 [Candidatus Limnocylindrales bacterium]|nr:hypothetical protein [Candidatus Limnocylindrales bacterium]
MRFDLYTKTVLTIIMLLLSIVALRPLVSPAMTAQAQSRFSGLLFSGNAKGFWLFNERNGDAWWYSTKDTPPGHVKLQSLGEPLVRTPR